MLTSQIQQRLPDIKSSIDRKEVKQLQIPKYSSDKEERKRIWKSDVAYILSQYDSNKDPLAQDPENISNLRNLVEQKWKDIEELGPEELFDLIILLEKSKADSDSIGDICIKSLKYMFERITSTVFRWEDLLHMLNALRCVKLANAHNLFTLMECPFAQEISTDMFSLRGVPLIDSTIANLCGDRNWFYQFFRTLQVIRAHECNSPEFIRALVARSKKAYLIEKFLQILYLNKLDIKKNLRTLFTKTDEELDSLLMLFSPLPASKTNQYLYVMTQDHLDLIMQHPKAIADNLQSWVDGYPKYDVTSERFGDLIGQARFSNCTLAESNESATSEIIKDIFKHVFRRH